MTDTTSADRAKIETLIKELKDTAVLLRDILRDPDVPARIKQFASFRLVFIENTTLTHERENDFLVGSKACDLSGEGTCEACQ